MSWLYQPLLQSAAQLAFVPLPTTEDFEGGALPASFDIQTTSGGGSGVIDSTSKVNGTYSVKLGASATGASYLTRNLGANYTELYIQFSIFIPTGFAYNTATSFVPLHINDAGGNTVVEMKLDDYGTQEIVLQGGTLAYTDTTLALSKNTVHRVELYYKTDATTGAWKVWVDNGTEGSPDASASSLNTGTAQMHTPNVGLYYTDGSLTDYYYIDDVIISDSFIGVSSSYSGTPGVASLTTTNYTPTVAATANQYITTASPSSLTLSPQTPTAVASDNKTVTTASPSSLSLTAQTPTVTVSDNQIATPGAGSLTTTNYAPTVAATDNQYVTTASPTNLTLTAFEPTVAATANQYITTAEPTSLVTTPQTPTVSATANQYVTTASPTSLTLSPQEPTVTTGNNISVTPGTASLTTELFSPTVAFTDNKLVTPGIATLTTTLYTPDVAASSGSTVTPGTASLALTNYEPSMTVSDNKFVVLDAASLALTSYSPTVETGSGNVAITPGLAEMITAMFTPTVSVSNNIAVTPGTRRAYLRASYPIINGQIREKSYYIDSNGNVYWVISQAVGLVEKV